MTSGATYQIPVSRASYPQATLRRAAIDAQRGSDTRRVDQQVDRVIDIRHQPEAVEQLERLHAQQRSRGEAVPDEPGCIGVTG